MKRKTITLIATLGLLLTGCGTNTSSVLASDSLTPETSTDQPEKEHTGIKTVTPLKTETYDILVCYQENNISDTSKLSLTTTAPIFLYFGDGAYIADTAKELLKKNGLAEVAAEQGSSIVIVNPLNGSTCSDQDKDVYSAIYSLFSDSSSATLTDGISIDPTDETKTKKIAGSYPMSVQRKPSTSSTISRVSIPSTRPVFMQQVSQSERSNHGIFSNSIPRSLPTSLRRMPASNQEPTSS